MPARSLFSFLVTLVALSASAVAADVCGDVYAGTWRNPPFGYDIYRNGAAYQFTSGVFDAPENTPIAMDAAGNLFHAQTIDAQGTVRVYRNNVALHTYGPRGGPSWVYSGIGLAVKPDGTWFAAFYTDPTTVTVYINGNTPYRTYTAYDFGYSPLHLAWDEVHERLYAVVRTGSATASVYAEDTSVAAYAQRGCGLATRAGHWYTCEPVGTGQMAVYQDGKPWTTITGAFTARYSVELAVDGRGHPFILAPVSGGQFGLFDKSGKLLYNLPNTAAGGGIGLWIQLTAACRPGDLNCDGVVDFGDINPFVLALTNPAAYQAQYPNCPFDNRDINGDGLCDFGDINPFVRLLSNP